MKWQSRHLWNQRIELVTDLALSFKQVKANEKE